MALSVYLLEPSLSSSLTRESEICLDLAKILLADLLVKVG